MADIKPGDNVTDVSGAKVTVMSVSGTKATVYCTKDGPNSVMQSGKTYRNIPVKQLRK